MAWFALAAAFLTWGLTGAYVHLMTAQGQLDAPNSRSMHNKAKPSGSGIVAIPVVLLLWWLSVLAVGDLNRIIVPCALALSIIGWADDMWRMSARVRFITYLAVIGIYLALLPRSAHLFPLLPLLVERALLAFALLWYVNLFNFMDGIDGIAGAQAASLGIGFVAVAGIAVPGSTLAILIAAAMIGYLFWNWAPGSVMMGDAGSIPLGFLTGILMLELAFQGYLAAAMILPAYFCIDATVTLLRRMLAGHRFAEPHREHFYQRAATMLSSHAAVVTAMLAANGGLILMAVLSRSHPLLGVGGALLTLIAFLAWLSLKAGTRAPA